VSHYLVGAESVALGTSRGYETTIHKAFLRGSVLVLDGIYIGAIWMLARRVVGCGTTNKDGMASSFGVVVVTALAQPGLILIDHGHFQYNSVCLGLSLLSFYYLSSGDDGGTTAIGTNAIIGSILFCLALNWKQMGLYYAPAVFSYLLGRCCCRSNPSNRPGAAGEWGWWFRQILQRISALAFTVLSTFGILLTPFIYYRDASSQTIGDVLLLILRRIFPFQRGLFEGKVSNLWCMLSVKPLSIRDRIPQEYQPIVALAATMGLAFPFCVILFKIGSEGHQRDNGKTTTTTMSIQQRQQRHLKALLWGSAGTSLSFFLASFQVHEKSILLPLAPLSLLIMEAPTFIIWVSLVATWSLWHLLEMDRLQVPYVCVSVLFFVVVRACFAPSSGGGSIHTTIKRTNNNSVLVRWGGAFFTKCVVPVSFVLMAGLHLMELVIPPPSHMPDIFPVLWVIAGCLFFCVTWSGILHLIWLEFDSDRAKGVVTDTSTSTSRLKRE